MTQMKKRKLSGYFAVQSMIFTTLIVMFFVVGIIVYYSMLYAETREHITKIGELNAETSAEQIDKYLSSGVDVLRMTGYTLDNMIRNGNSQEEILAYLENQSIAASNITSGNSPGFYGYINNGYLDGTGWVPETDYAPLERPWYVEAKANIGRVSVVGPYVDSRTHRNIITLSKTLCDVKSVIAMDFSMDQLQKIAEDLTAHGKSYAEIVLNREYKVLAHSDKSEIGKCYFTEPGSFGNALIDELRSTDENYFFLRYEGADYIVYTTTVANDWFCVSVIDATSSLRRLKRPLIFIFAAALTILAVQLVIIIRSNKNTQIAKQLSDDLSEAENAISEKDSKIGEISKLAFKDALTGVGSKSAFNSLTAELAEKHKTSHTPTAVVMLDVNVLKNVNDTFGHDAGDKYLCGCCGLICEIFRYSPVFRIGGDEFVAVLRNADFSDREKLLQKLRDACDESYSHTDRMPWERYSIAAGMSDWLPDEPDIEQALLRADKAMYDSKRSFKERHKELKSISR